MISRPRGVQRAARKWLNQCVDYIDGNHEFVQSYVKANIPMIKVRGERRARISRGSNVTAVAKQDRREGARAPKRNKLQAASVEAAGARTDGGAPTLVKTAKVHLNGR